MPVSFRPAAKSDVKTILKLILELAEYEHMADQVTATEEVLTEWLFTRRTAEVMFILNDESEEIGYMLFFHNFSTFQGRGGVYLEDVYIRPEYRGRGWGKAAFRELARLAAERVCGRIEWLCLDWNKPSIDFYLSPGAEPLSEWTKYRLTEDAIRRLAEVKD